MRQVWGLGLEPWIFFFFFFRELVRAMTNFICDMLKSPLVVWNETSYKILSVPFWDLSGSVTLAFA